STGITAESITTGSVSDTIGILSNHAPESVFTGAGTNTINVGNAGSVQGIEGTLNLEEPPSFNAIVVDNSADTTGRVVTFSSFSPNPADSESNADVWGKINKLAPADINYEFSDTAALTI